VIKLFINPNIINREKTDIKQMMNMFAKIVYFGSQFLKASVLCFVFFISNVSYAQNWLWAKSGYDFGGNDEGYSVSTDTWGNVFITGKFTGPTITFGTQTLTRTGTGNLYIVKYDTKGNVLWAKSPSGGYSEGRAVSTDFDGNVFVTGYFEGSITFGSITLTKAGIFIVKYDPNGNVLWAKGAGGSNDEGNSVSADAIGDVFVTGNYTSSTIVFGLTTLTNLGSKDVFIVKYDPNGNVLWAKSAGGSSYDEGNSVSSDRGGNVLVTGQYGSQTIVFDTSVLTNSSSVCTDLYIAKYDANGNLLWVKSEGGSNFDEGWGVCTDRANNIFLTGDFASPSLTLGPFTLTNTGNYDAFIAKFDPNGNILWAKSAEGVGMDFGFSVSTDTVGNVFMSGGNNDKITFGSIVLIPSSNAYDPMFIVKYDANGKLLCASGIDGGGDDLNSVSADLFGNAYISGDFVTFDVVIGNETLHKSGQADIFVAKWICNCPLTASISSDTSICSGQNCTLTASGGTSYLWSNSATTPSIIVSPITTTFYSVIVSNGNCSDTASTSITVYPRPTAIISGNTNICLGEITTLSVSGAGTYYWSTGSTSNSISISPNKSTSYDVIVTSTNGCKDTASTSILVTPFPVALVSINSTICEGNDIILSATGGSTYYWNTGEVTSSIQTKPKTSTNYSVIVSNGNCSDTAYTTVFVKPNPIANAGVDVTINGGSSSQLNATGGATYSWFPPDGLSCTNCQNPVANPLQTITYTVTVRDTNGCISTDKVTVTIDCGDIFVPNFFSPNSDGQNDLECVYGNCITSITFLIFDRWGEKIFETNDKQQCWDGTYKGKMLDDAVFAYYLKATFIDGKEIFKKGNISLVR
jgi:gliding motility-associated-like protein